MGVFPHFSSSCSSTWLIASHMFSKHTKLLFPPEPWLPQGLPSAALLPWAYAQCDAPYSGLSVCRDLAGLLVCLLLWRHWKVSSHRTEALSLVDFCSPSPRPPPCVCAHLSFVSWFTPSCWFAISSSYLYRAVSWAGSSHLAQPSHIGRGTALLHFPSSLP